MTERRYSEDEIRRIFGAASDRDGSRARAYSPADGLTLPELQSIGREVGLDPALVAEAATALDAVASRVRRTSLGMPIEVGRMVELPAAPTDEQWESLVAELRSTFRARGRVSRHGGLREWWNGNLHACIEAGEGRTWLRLGTRKSGAGSLNALGVTGVVTGAVAFGGMLLSGGLLDAVFVPTMISAAGVGALLANMLRLPPWARTREQQMEHIAARARAIVAAHDAAPDRER